MKFLKVLTFLILASVKVTLLLATDYVVDNNADTDNNLGNNNPAGSNTLRKVIRLVNAEAEGTSHKIRFNIPGTPGQVQTITLNSELPHIVRSVVIDGSVNPDGTPKVGYVKGSQLLIEIKGAASSRGYTGFIGRVSDIQIKGIKFNYAVIYIQSLIANTNINNIRIIDNIFDNSISYNVGFKFVSNSEIKGNIFKILPSNKQGIYLHENSNITIGGFLSGEGNKFFIDGSGPFNSSGVHTFPGNANSQNHLLIINNDFVGSSSLNLSQSSKCLGIEIQSGLNPIIESNTFNSLHNGIYLNPHSDIKDLTIKNNKIGVDASGSLPKGNYIGIYIRGYLFRIQNILIENNVISGNKTGIYIYESTGVKLINNNKIGTDINGNNSIPNERGVVFENSNNNTIGGYNGLSNIIANSELDGIKIESGSNNTILGNTIYNNGISSKAINLNLGTTTQGNGGKAVPVIKDVVFSSSTKTLTITGTTTEASDKIDIFASNDNNPQNAHTYIATVTASATAVDGLYNWSYTSIYQNPLNSFVATATSATKNTSEFGFFKYTNPCSEITYYTPIITQVYPLNQALLLPTAVKKLDWKFISVPPLTTNTLSNYTVLIQVAPETRDAEGGAMGDWTNKVEIKKIYSSSNLRAGTTYTEILTPFVDAKNRVYYWRVGLQYEKAEASGRQPIVWSEEYKFTLPSVDPAVPAANYLAAGNQNATTHTNKINWVYEVTYLDNGQTSESISYVDGVGKIRQGQALSNATPSSAIVAGNVMCSEVVYSEEGGGSVQSMAAPLHTNKFGYAYRFFDVAEGTTVRDFQTKDFDMENSSTNTPIAPTAIEVSSSNPQGVGYYYSNLNSYENAVDDAQGFPYSYSVSEKNQLGLPLMTGNVGGDFKITGGKEIKYIYGTPVNEELERIFGSAAPQAGKVSKTIVYDANGVGTISYTDNEGKTLATAMTACSSTNNLTPLKEDGMVSFNTTQSIIAEDNLDLASLSKTASRKFITTCANQTVTLNYNLGIKAFNTGGTDCKGCKYQIVVTITEDATGKVIYNPSPYTVNPADACTTTGTQSLINNITLTVDNAGSYTVTREVRPLKDAQGVSTLENIIKDQINSYTVNKESYRPQFEDEVLAPTKYFLFRQSKTSRNRVPNSPSLRCVSRYAGDYSVYGNIVRGNRLLTKFNESVDEIEADGYGNLLIVDSARYRLSVIDRGSGTVKVLKTFSERILDLQSLPNGEVYILVSRPGMVMGYGRGVDEGFWSYSSLKGLKFVLGFKKEGGTPQNRPWPVLGFIGNITNIPGGDFYGSFLTFAMDFIDSTLYIQYLTTDYNRIAKIPLKRKVNPNNNISPYYDLAIGANSMRFLEMKFDERRNLEPNNPAFKKLYILDSYNHSIYSLNDNNGTAGAYSLVTGGNSTTGSYQEGTLTSARYNNITDFEFDATGNIYVSDQNKCIRKIDLVNGVTSLISGKPAFSRLIKDGLISEAQYLNPHHLALDNSGNIYVAEDRAVRRINAIGCDTVASGTCPEIPARAALKLNPQSTSMGQELQVNWDFSKDKGGWYNWLGLPVDLSNKVTTQRALRLDANFKTIYTSNILTKGKAYKLSFKITSSTAGFSVKQGNRTELKRFNASTTSATASIEFVANGKSLFFESLAINGTSASTTILDDISIKELGTTNYNLFEDGTALLASPVAFNTNEKVTIANLVTALKALNNINYNFEGDGASNILTVTGKPGKGKSLNGRTFSLRATPAGGGTMISLDQQIMSGGLDANQCDEFSYSTDEVRFVDINEGNYSKMLVDADGDANGDGLPGDESYKLTGTPTTATKQPTNLNDIKSDFIKAYSQKHWYDIPSNEIKTFEVLEVPTGSTLGATIAALKDNKKLDPTNMIDYYLVKVKFPAPSCESRCTAKTDNVDCNQQCYEQQAALNASLIEARQKVEAFSTTVTFGSPAKTLKQIIDEEYPNIAQETIDAINGNESAKVVFADYDYAQQAIRGFNQSECVSFCKNPQQSKCSTCENEYNACITGKMGDLNDGYSYLMDTKWKKDESDKPVSTFPYTFADLSTSEDLNNETERANLGDLLFNYIKEKLKAGTIGTRADWEATGSISTCIVCPSPGKDGCKSIAPDPNSVYPVKLIDILNTSAYTECNTDYERCFKYSDPATLQDQLCADNIAKCKAQFTKENPNYNSTSNCLVGENGVCEVYPGDCDTKYSCNQADPLKGDKKQLIAQTVSRLYSDYRVVEQKVDEIYSQFNDKSKTMAELSKYLMEYESIEGCLLACRNELEYRFSRWIETKKTQTKETVVRNFINQCYGSMNENFTVTYSQQYYHYTLYNYNKANDLVSTVPPEGVDFVDKSSLPSHRMLTTYNSNTLGLLQNSSSPEMRSETPGDYTKATLYLYDKAGRVRFSQSQEQIERGIKTAKTIFSYTKYDSDMRIVEVGEYNGTSVVGFIKGAGQTGVFASDNLESSSWPTSAVGGQSQQNFFEYNNNYTINGFPQGPYMKGRICRVFNFSGSTTYYSYDAHGRVSWVIQDMPALGFSLSDPARYKKIDYEYEPLTGRLNKSVYQPNLNSEQLIHHYLYDSDNRLSEVRLSKNYIKPVFEKGSALKFDGVDDKVNISNFSLSGGGAVTVEFWVKVKAADLGNTGLFSMGTSTHRFTATMPWGDKMLYWDYGNTGTGGRVALDFSNYFDEWTHVALVSEGRGGKFAGIYINGELMKSANVSDGPPFTYSNFVLGNFFGNYHFKGMVNEFRIWNKVRTKEEINSTINSSISSPTPNLIASWTMDEAKGTVLTDASGMGKTGTISGASWVPLSDLNNTSVTAAKYDYYRHGSIKNITYGENIQKVDYYYNIVGWLKAINNPFTSTDPSTMPQDAFSLMLNYYNGDYKRLNNKLDANATVFTLGGNARSILPTTSNSYMKSTSTQRARDLYNGNISSMVTNTAFDKVGMSTTPNILIQGFRYDMLNRLLESYSETKKDGFNFDGYNLNAPAVGTKDIFKEIISYDANGNIANLTRTSGNESNNAMDKMTYSYNTVSITKNGVSATKKYNNMLMHVKDTDGNKGLGDIIGAGTYSQTTPTTANYTYDAKGRIIADVENEIAEIKWTAYDKVAEVIRTSSSKKPDLKFFYDAAGKKIRKQVIDKVSPMYNNKTIYYIYDASGNLMATYENAFDGKTMSYITKMVSQTLYGAKRIGELNTKSFSSSLGPVDQIKRQSRFELTDHLGNVQAVVTGEVFTETDKPAPVDIESSFEGDDSFKFRWGNYASQMSQEDKFSGSSSIKVTFTVGTGWGPQIRVPVKAGDIVSAEVMNKFTTAGDYPALVVNFVTDSDGSVKWEEATASSTTPGTWQKIATKDLTVPTGATYALILPWAKSGSGFQYFDDIKIRVVGNAAQSIPVADIVNLQNYYPFGMGMNERRFTSEKYKFGFNGEERDYDWNSNGDEYDYGFRMYDPRIARFQSVDPLADKFPMLSPYQFASNTPIWALDLDGLEARVYNNIGSFDDIIPHSFISVIDDEGVINVYTFGQYGQNNPQWFGTKMYNNGSALIHYKGDAANDYINYQFNHYGESIQVFEISDKAVDKQAIIEYYSKEMKDYTIPAGGNRDEIEILRRHPNTGSKGVLYKPYYLTPDGCYTENCSSTVLDGLRAGGEKYIGNKWLGARAVPWDIHLSLKVVSVFSDNYNNVTKDAKSKASQNINGTPQKASNNNNGGDPRRPPSKE